MLRAEAAEFTPQEVGSAEYNSTDYTKVLEEIPTTEGYPAAFEDLNDLNMKFNVAAHELTAAWEELCSTAAPSPQLTAVGASPMFSPYWGMSEEWNGQSPFGPEFSQNANGLSEAVPFSLPESANGEADSISPAYIAGGADGEPCFVLAGIEDLQSNLASVLSKHLPESPDDEETAKSGVKLPPGLDLPPGLEFMASADGEGVVPPPGLAGSDKKKKKSNGATTVAELHAKLNKKGKSKAAEAAVEDVEEVEEEKVQTSSTGVLPPGCTTAMLRNIPNKYTQNTLLQEINEVGFEGTYNFFYLPMDVHNRSNVGYAFINFERPVDAERFRRSFSDHRFQRFHSRKIGIVCIAHVQGLDENLRHFENRAVTQARNDQYRPIVLKGQRRIDFEDAVTEAKARIAQREAQQQAKNPHSKQVSGANKPKSPTDNLVNNGQQPKVVPSEKLQGTTDARQGLEAAIRDLLASSPAARPATSASTSPGSSFDAAAGAPNSFGCFPKAEEHVNGAAPQQLQQGANGNGFNPSLYGTTGCQDDVDSDVAQLLSLRSLLVDRLLQKNQAMNPNMKNTMSAAWGLAPPPGIDLNTNLKATKLAPGSQDLIIGRTADGFAYDTHWCSL
mmetsp:Transcript_59123/g.111479  ORF Transcript_59123/g.111479 Transcript_59123/m.111479 type:complete len:616 (-) Transcript_59123:166-2013(-)